MKIDIEGGQTGIYRGVDSSVKVRVSNCRTEGSVVTTLEDHKYDGEMDISVTTSSVFLNMNGKMMIDDQFKSDQDK